jgi:sulfide:quinone oxidoreductase
MSQSRTFNVLIVGGGSAALEAAFRLQRVAEHRVRTTIVAPDEYFATHAVAVLVPFSAGAVPHESLAGMASDAGARLRRGRMTSVDIAAHQVITAEGETIDYDALLIAVGAVPRAHPHALAFGGPGTEERMHGLVQDLEAGVVRRIAFVVPEGATWPVPLYELALLTAERAYDMCLNPELTVVTSEEAPLELFGAEGSHTMANRLTEAGVVVVTGKRAEIPTSRLVELYPGEERLSVDRVVTLPTLEGPAVPGLPHDADGYLHVDRHGRVRGAPDVYAAGDATHHPVKQGGLACQQADAAAEAIAARAGAAIDPQPYTPILQGVLLTERAATFLRPEATADTSGSDRALRWPPTKIAGRELALHVGGQTHGDPESQLVGLSRASRVSMESSSSP